MEILQVVFFIVLGICLLGMVWALYMLDRNNKVFNYRQKISSILFAREDWEELLDIADQTDYSEMVWKFWKPLESFYPDEFLKNLGMKGEK